MLVRTLRERGMTIATMESCTGGAIIDAITAVEGASYVTEGGYVTYSNAQKIRVGVPQDIIEVYGVYSPECAFEMANTVKTLLDSSIGIGVTGTLSNVDTNNADSKQGEVHFCIVQRNHEPLHRTIQVPVMDRSLQKTYITRDLIQCTLEILEARLQ